MSSNDIAFSHGSEAIREAIIRSKLKAPDCSVQWQTINQIRLLKFDGLINGEEQYPTRDLQIFLFKEEKFKRTEPNLTKEQAFQKSLMDHLLNLL
jgi:hypothetical protein